MSLSTQTLPASSASAVEARGNGRALSGFRLTVRDVEIVDAIFRHRVLTAPLVSALYFGTDVDGEPSSRARKRLRLLHEHGFLERAEQASRLEEGRKPLLYFLGEAGARLLADTHGVPEAEITAERRTRSLSHTFLEHLLLENRIRVVFTLAARQSGARIEQWIDDASLRSKQMTDYVHLKGPRGGTRRTAIIPDGYFTLEADGYTYHHFVEADRGTVTLQSGSWHKRGWARKVAAYIEYQRSGLFGQRYGARGFRVLTVTTGAERLTHLKAVTEKAGGKNLFWFVDAELLRANVALAGRVWQVAGRGETFALLW